MMRRQNLKYRVIYAIKCLPTGKMYVGSAEKYWNRYYTHLGALNANRHANNYLQKAWNKYGRDSFLFAIIEELSDTDNIAEKEQYWMNYFKVCDRRFGFNIYPNARTSLGYKYSDSSKLKMSQAKKGIPLSEKHKEKMRLAKVIYHPMRGRIGESNPLSKPIIQLDICGNVIHNWGCITQCAIELQLHKGGIIACLKGRLKTSGGFVFKYGNNKKNKHQCQ